MEQDPVEDDLRGWSWDRPPIRPRAYLGLSIGDVAYRYCPTKRDVYLRKRGIKGISSKFMIKGSIVHSIFHIASEDVKRELILGFKGWEVYEKLSLKAEERLKELGIDVENDEWMLSLYKRLILSWCADEWITLFTEFKVDGSLLGLSRNLRTDGLAEGGVVLEVKYGRPFDFHKLALAGYALALESDLEAPFDYGLLLYIQNFNENIIINWEPVYISSSLRREFLEERDNVIDMLISDREPPKPVSCPESCPFRGECK